MDSEVGHRSTPSKTNEQTNVQDTRLGEINVPNAGAIHNPTIEKQANELKEINGKARIRGICGTMWCQSTEERDAEYERIFKIFNTELKFICYGDVEKTEENKKNHLHYLVMFTGQKQWKTIIKSFDPHKYHIEPARKPNAAYSYCKKHDPDNIREWGEPPKQGARTDLKKC